MPRACHFTGVRTKVGNRIRYRGRANTDTLLEAALAIYFAGAILSAAAAGLWAALPFLLLFELGFAYSAVATLRQAATR